MSDLVQRLRAYKGESFVADDVHAAADEIEALEAELAACKQRLHNVYEVYAGSEGIPQPETCAEAYLYQLVMEMARECKE